MEWVIIWLGLSILAAVMASHKGRSGWGFFFLAVVLSPLIGLIAAAVASPNQVQLEQRTLTSGQARQCPYCAELVKPAAVVCRYCGRDLQTSSTRTVFHASPEAEPYLTNSRRCESCDKAIPVAAVRCLYCGVLQSVPSQD